jgi:hypothetical protein
MDTGFRKTHGLTGWLEMGWSMDLLEQPTFVSLISLNSAWIELTLSCKKLQSGTWAYSNRMETG